MLLSMREIIVTVPRSMILKCSDCGNQLIIAPFSEHSPGISLLRSEELLQHETILQRVQTNGAVGISESKPRSWNLSTHALLLWWGKRIYAPSPLSVRMRIFM